MPPAPSKAYAPGLGALLALFCVRVLAQPLALVVDIPWLPAFDRWHSGLLPYGVLLALQGLILLVFARTTLAFSRATVVANPAIGKGLLLGGGLYMTAMIARLVLGLTLLRGHPWFDVPLPTLFHFVLAGFILLVGTFHARHGPRRIYT